MKTDRLNTRKRINTKEELIELLNRYKGILSYSMISYLNSLIQLEFSVVRDYIEEKDRESLAELELYKKVAIYNIYNRALTLLKDKKIKYSFLDDEDGYEKLTIFIHIVEKKPINVFDFDYKEFHSDNWSLTKIPAGYKTMKIGTISLYQTLVNETLREKELNRVRNNLEKLYYNRAKFQDLEQSCQYVQEIERYEKIFAELKKRKDLNDCEKREIEMTNKIHDLLLKDYGLTNQSFEEEKNPIFYDNEPTLLQRTLIKKQPNLSIINHIKYL